LQGVDDDVADTALAVCDTDIKRQPGKNIGAAVRPEHNETDLWSVSVGDDDTPPKLDHFG
jgi:hypothetical protein